jgi:glycosyltransferase involved in cell wall biosynthesis
MRILIITSQFPPDSYGGVETVAIGIGKQYIQLGHEVGIITGRIVSELDEHATLIREEVLGFPIWRILVNLETHKQAFHRAVYDESIIQPVQKATKEFSPDVMHVLQLGILTTSVFDAILQLDLPLTYTATNYESVCAYTTLIKKNGETCDGQSDFLKCLDCQRHHTLLANSIYFLMQNNSEIAWLKLLKFTKKIIPRKIGILEIAGMQYFRWKNLSKMTNSLERILAPSKFVKNILVSNGFCSNKIVVIPHGLAEKNNNGERATHNRTEILRFGYIGRLDPVKGIHVLIKAFKSLPSVFKTTLAIYGTANPFEEKYLENLKQLADGDERISFKGRFERQEIDKVYSGLDVLVVPSLWYEVYGMIVLEAISYGIPVMASNIGGLAEVVLTNQAGWIFPPGDVTSLNELMIACLKDRMIIDKIAEKIQNPRNVNIEAQDLLSIYSELISSHKTI